MNILLIILAAIEGIAAFISTWLGCSSMCGRQIDSHGVSVSLISCHLKVYIELPQIYHLYTSRFTNIFMDESG